MRANTERLDSSLLVTAHGSHRHSFGIVEWALLGAVAAIWGSSFLFIAEGLESFAPAFVTGVRFALGLLTLALFPAARTPIAREDWRSVALVGVVWMALPMYLFPVAQQWISSSLAGMINGAVPLFAAVIAAVLLRTRPRRVQIFGLIIGFAGVVLVSARGGSSTENGYLGVGLLLVAVACYGVGVNIAVPLQQRYGALPVLLRALAIATVLTLPIGLFFLPSGPVSLSSSAALVALGSLGTGLAFVAMTTLVGRAGATRGAVATYFIPIVALVLGVGFRNEEAPLVSLIGIALILIGAWFTSRSEQTHER
ncbi:MAG: DMT family transporter [Acidimicrobiia bacterium]|nr:DMT family transporter [Acidimicrobiia bacterium]